MRRLPQHDVLEKLAIEMGIKPTDRRRSYRCFAVLLMALVAFSTFALTPPAAAQDGAASASAQHSRDAGANGLYRIGGDVSAPVLVHQVAPKYPESARKAKIGGNVLVNMWVDVNGNPSHIRVIRGLGMDLDESAVTAVRQYKFKPAMKNGTPVLVEVNLEVNYQIR
jgi:TonB family protein